MLSTLKGPKGNVPLLLFVVAYGLGSGKVNGDVVHLKTGGVVDIGWDYRISGEKVIIHKEAGTIAIPLSDVSRIEKTERKDSPRSLSTAVEAQEASEGTREEALEAEQTTSIDSGELASIIEEVLGFLQRVKSSQELPDQEREDGLKLVKIWTNDARALLGQVSPADSKLREVGEDFARALETLERELGDGILKSKEELEVSLKSMLERL